MKVLMRFFWWALKHRSPLIRVCQRRMSEARQLKVPYLGILGYTSVHFFEPRHGSAAVFA